MNDSPTLATPRLARAFVTDVLPQVLLEPLFEPRKEEAIIPTEECDPILSLDVLNGYGCTYCSYVTVATDLISKHFNNEHALVRRGRGGYKYANHPAIRELIQRRHYGDKAPWEKVKCQRLFRTGQGSRLLRVRDGCAEQPSSGDSQPCLPTGERTAGDAVVDDVLRTLSSVEARQAADVTVVGATSKKAQASPWLERTRWPCHLAGIRLDDAVDLARPPDQGESILDTLSASVDRLIQQAYVSVCEDRINFFAQRCISSFLPHRKAYSQPLMVKLQKATYSTYKDLWKRLLCFVCRTSDLRQSAPLRYTLTSRQTAALDARLSCAERITHVNHLNPSPGSIADDKVHQQLDSLCLAFCIALLDHQLKGDLFDSVVLGYLAVVGIDRNNATFYEAASYTSKLSGFIKISQMLVLQQAVHEAEGGIFDNALDPLNEMRERFMTIDCCTPFSWAVSLRSYGKKIRDSTTSIGYIQWSDDESTLYYRNIELQISAFRTMVANEVTRAQRLLESLFLLSIDETREDVVPAVQLYRLRDNPTVITNGWNFLQDERNQDSLPSKKRWLLQRVLQSDELREDFISRDRFGRVVWQKAAVKQYLKQVDAFLEALLLLVHLTAGQPARGTEIIGLLHTNTSLHRNIFIEDGLVSVLTSYHKGYSCTGATKIIHRYLPKEISELYVYYMWMIYPFVHELSLLSPYAQFCGSSFLWPDKEGSWSSGRLSAVLKRQTESALKAPMTILIYRHVAIAISRRHLRSGGFKRDYDLTDAASDLQTTHTSWTAGRLYARGLEEAPGHIEARRAGFRAVSREWHAFLGFVDGSLPRKRPLGENLNLGNLKRRRTFSPSTGLYV